jgi:hypothetical protein
MLSVPDVTERLMAEFGSRVDLAVISQVVLDCHRDLQGSPEAALPELVERLARQYLLDLLDKDPRPREEDVDPR